MNAYDFTISLILAFLASLVATPGVAWLAARFGVLDRPNGERKLHKRSMPLLGGVAIFVSFALLVWLYSTGNGGLLGDTIRMKNIIGILVGALLLVVGGALDDKYNLKPHFQIIAPIAAVLAIIASGIGIDWVSNPLGEGLVYLNQHETILFWWQGIAYKITPLADMITVVWLLCMIYTTKVLDGLDGLVSGITVISSIFIFLIALNKGDIAQPEVALLAMIVAGVFAGFLVFNFNPAKIFLGEAGSTLAGFFLGVMSIVSGSKIGITLMLMSIPVLDLLWTLIRRRIKFSSADRKHLHFRLLDAGLSMRQAVLLLYAITLVFGILVYQLQDYGAGMVFMGLLALIVFMLIFAYIYKKTKERGLA